VVTSNKSKLSHRYLSVFEIFCPWILGGWVCGGGGAHQKSRTVRLTSGIKFILMGQTIASSNKTFLVPDP